VKRSTMFLFCPMQCEKETVRETVLLMVRLKSNVRLQLSTTLHPQCIIIVLTNGIKTCACITCSVTGVVDKLQ